MQQILDFENMVFFILSRGPKHIYFFKLSTLTKLKYIYLCYPKITGQFLGLLYSAFHDMSTVPYEHKNLRLKACTKLLLDMVHIHFRHGNMPSLLQFENVKLLFSHHASKGISGLYVNCFRENFNSLFIIPTFFKRLDKSSE